MRTLGLLFLTVAMASLIAMFACFFLALFGDLFGPAVAERHWSRLALPLGMGTLFFFGIGGALLREGTARAELDRAVNLLRRDVGEALEKGEDASDVLRRAYSAVDRFRRAAYAAPGLAPRDWLDLADLIVYADTTPPEACGYLQDLYAAVTKAAAKSPPASAPPKGGSKAAAKASSGA